MADFLLNISLLVLVGLSILFSVFYLVGEVYVSLTFGALAIISWYSTAYYWLITVTPVAAVAWLFFLMGLVFTISFLNETIMTLRGRSAWEES